MTKFSTKIYDSWKEKQLQKYEQLFPILKPFLSNEHRVLDLGIGKAWIEEFLSEKGFKFKKIIGVDISENAVTPKKSNIKYILSKKFNSKEKFDLIICFDSLHLLKNYNLMKLAKPSGIILISLPSRLKEKLVPFKSENILAEGVIGKEEKDFFVLIQTKTVI